MQLLLNEKPMELWNKNDLQIIIDNAETYHENHYIDFKKTFGFLDVNEKDPNRKKRISEEKNELRNDVCAFANADSGYLFFGIEESKGEPHSICGVQLENKDKFELDIRNILSAIQPAAPPYKICFINIENDKYVIIIHVDKGVYIPYVSRKRDEAYSFYIRSGNGKRIMEYNEVGKMFKYNMTLSDSIDSFVQNRITKQLNSINMGTPKRIATLHIIPDDFQNPCDISKMYVKRYEFKQIFEIACIGTPIPFSDGILYNNQEYNNGLSTRIFNNGITELCLDLNNSHFANCDNSHEIIVIGNFLRSIINFAKEYLNNSELFSLTKRFFFIFSLYGCKGMVILNEWKHAISCVVDNEITCSSITLFDVNSSEMCQELIDNLIMTICLSCGVQNIDALKQRLDYC